MSYSPLLSAPLPPSLPPSSGDRGSNIVSYVTSPQLRVAAVIPDHTPPLIMSYDERDNTHTLWSVKAATSKVINYLLIINQLIDRICRLLPLLQEEWLL